ncbi:hypothetical protein LSH36_15g19075 [Paralvinella palmiformis]|uniref:PAN2-PAN3 deadenylation complex subunit PAN3 n=1 Tax=Paralvinella palmiformis TaxID=53620 RepID=A0AAD9KCK1_9ANNE|nr:hypothetical protein LSH36_15g19075 [Paralvinella palmiformis]
MNSAVPFAKKPALCRYFVTNGSCMYGNECQFLHENPGPGPGPSRTRSKFIGPNQLNQTSVFENSDGNNGDQFFSATFGASNGIGEFPPYGNPSAASRNSPMTAIDGPKANPFLQTQAVSSADDSVLNNQMAALSVGAPLGKAQPPNATAAEFIPKGTSVSQSSLGLTHSASSPSFMSNYNPLSSPNSSTLSGVGRLQPAMALSSAVSPISSPHLSPQGSPLINHRSTPPVVDPTLASNGHSHTPPNRLVQENVGGTTYFYTQEDLSSQHQGVVLPNFTMFTSILPHVAHMKPRAHQPSFFMPDELKLDILNKHAISLMQVDQEHNRDIPLEVDNYHNLFPLEPPVANVRKSSTFGYQTSVYKATSTKDGMLYCLRRIHGYRWMNTKTADLWKCVDLWKKMQHANIVQLREVFTTKAFGDHSMVFVYDYHPGAETLMIQHFSSPNRLNGYTNNYPYDGTARPYSADKGKGLASGRQHSGLLPESLLWTYIVQLTSALRTIHAHHLACRVLDPTKIIITDKSRLRLNCVGIFDVLSFDSNQANPVAVIPHYQQEDLSSLGKVILALACNSIIGIQRDRLQTSMEIVNRNYSADLRHFLMYLLGGQNRMRSINDVMPMIGARFYTQLDAALSHNDVIEQELSKEVENGRLFRLICKLGTINERPQFNLDPSWSETGDRYMLKLFRDYLFHQIDESGVPWLDMAHVVQCLNKLDSGAPEKICLMSQDEQSILVVTYAELRQCLETTFTGLCQAAQSSGFS